MAWCGDLGAEIRGEFEALSGWDRHAGSVSAWEQHHRDRQVECCLARLEKERWRYRMIKADAELREEYLARKRGEKETRRRKNLKPHPCRWCFKLFRPRRGKDDTCSGECRAMARRVRKAHG